jgi:phosphoglycerate dehydrogenase-like enzyme
MTPPRPIVLLKPEPQTGPRIFTPAARARLESTFDVIDLEGVDDASAIDRALPTAFAVVGQPDLDTERLVRAQQLRAVINVEGNFFPNVDYQTAFQRGIRVLGCGTAYADAVAEMALGLAIDLARGITREDRAFREGRERYVSERTHDSILLRGSTIGLVGFGNIGRRLAALLQPFQAHLLAYDPWLPAAVLKDQGVHAARLSWVLSRSDIVFVLATVTSDSEHLLGAPQLDLLKQGARLVLVSRASVVDYGALYQAVAAGRLQAAVDVWPEEPMPRRDPARELAGLVMSPHRAGGIPQAFFEIGDMVCDDLELIAQGLPPARLQIAAPELVGRYRNRPVEARP